MIKQDALTEAASIMRAQQVGFVVVVKQPGETVAHPLPSRYPWESELDVSGQGLPTFRPPLL